MNNTLKRIRRTGYVIEYMWSGGCWVCDEEGVVARGRELNRDHVSALIDDGRLQCIAARLTFSLYALNEA